MRTAGWVNITFHMMQEQVGTGVLHAGTTTIHGAIKEKQNHAL